MCIRDSYYQSVYNSVGKTAGETIAEVYANEPVPTPEPIAVSYTHLDVYKRQDIMRSAYIFTVFS